MKTIYQKTGDFLLPKLNRCIKSNLNNEQFGVGQLATEVGMSRSNLYRKLKSATGKNISQYIREFRLKEAHKLLLDTDFNITEVSHKVGFGSISYFSKSFSDYFGYAPSAVRFEDMENLGKMSKDPFKITSKFSWVSNITIVVVLTCLVICAKYAACHSISIL